MKLGVLEHGLLTRDKNYKKTYNDVIDLCKYTEKLNFDSFWVSEQHDVNALVISYPLILLNHLANHTKKIKIGCGGIMLKHYQPYSIAEQINTLNILNPNRFIFGFGSNSGTEKIRQLLNSNNSENYYAKVLKVNEFLNNTNKNTRVKPFSDQYSTPVLLITSEQSAIFAAENKLDIIYGWFLNPSQIYAQIVIDTYIQTYKQKWGLQPDNIGLSVNIVSGFDTNETEQNGKIVAAFRKGVNNWNEFEYYPAPDEFNTEKYNFDADFQRFYKNVFSINSVQDVNKLDEFCKKLNVNNLILLPTMAKQEHKKLALNYVANFYKRNGE
ncbi:LLM class flavin-dependent oxidoreductase [Mycoplasmopsis phocirhinis]|uniref:LLM class flavin-dependent oxidoreductase n=1 Tax=Mycoplasmopsis phocirhinis TaxID=142650 RepID=A0A4P6MMN0_9BACT|nr:LLM class flavin-dependent oxidoreductase [Mycoplasmopsis phocirhinis]QBF34895.1 LLM class flavin-dependent oxidoreductase [Mycoplasmopsis phocirhinis]